jgi:hypothetical protein
VLRQGRCSPEKWVVSMGRRNTQAEPNLRLRTKAKSLAEGGIAGALPWLGFGQVRPRQIGSAGEAFSNQRIGWCRIDRLSWHALSEV